MILYDPDPTQLLSQETPDYISIKLPSGGFILASPLSNYEMEIVSINSTDPQDFLNLKYQPGRTIRLEYSLTHGKTSL